MQYRNRIMLSVALALLLGTLGACRPIGNASLRAEAANPYYSQVELRGDDFRRGSGNGFAIIDGGMTMQANRSAAEYVSPEIAADAPFNFVEPRWAADLPAAANLTLALRTAGEDGVWSSWQPVAVNPDASEVLTDTLVGGLLETADALRAQVSVTLRPGEDGSIPTLNALSLVFMDTSDGPTTAELSAALPPPAQDAQPQAGARYPKPPVITRAQWCTEPECTYSGVQYAPVTHLIIHHTVTSNESSDWAAVVRAIWRGHTFVNGWGDIGYNYLIDPLGNIYEGHLGGDDAIGTHAADANRGSMGVALLGTYSDSAPPEAMKAALVELLAWKVAQKGIDMWDASRLPLLDWGHLHLIGHRDVYGTTQCPGTTAHGLIAEIRQRVADRIGFVPQYSYFDELGSSFTLSNANWYNGPFNCGFNAHSYYTFSTSNPAESVNYGEWRPNVATPGRYQVDVFVPYCRTTLDDTQFAPYRITSAGGTTNLVRNQAANLGLWMPLGEYNFSAGTGNVVRLADLTASEDGKPVWFDALRIRLLGVALTNVAPAPDQWLRDRAVLFRWQLSSPEAVSQLRLQVASDANFGTLIADRTVAASSNQLLYLFDRDYGALHWRLIATKFDGQTVRSDATRFQIDATPPTSAITTALRNCDNSYTLNWQGSDNLAGIAHYDLAYRGEFETAWTTLLNDTPQTSHSFNLPNPAAAYRFRVQAVDVAGNAEPLKPDGDIGSGAVIPCNIAPPTLSEPAGNAWLRDRNVTLRWQIAQPNAVRSYQVEIATDQALSNVVARQSVNAPQQSATVALSADYAQLYWRVIATSLQDRTFPSTVGSFRLDATPPTSAVNLVLQRADGSYELRWGGSDALSGVRHYSVEYLAANSSSWTPLIANTTTTSSAFQPPNPALTYAFRSQASDNAGNVEPAKPAGDIDTTQACLFTNAPPNHILPAPDAWRSALSVTFRWGMPPLNCLQNVRVDLATDAAFGTIIHSAFLAPPQTTFIYEFDRPYAELYWRVAYTTLLNEQNSSPPTRFRFDTVAPTSRVTRVREWPPGRYSVEATGSDGESGISGYIYEVRAANSSEWRRFAIGSGAALFFPPDPAQTYWFRSLAYDVAGNNEVPDGGPGDFSSANAERPLRLYLPIIYR